MKLCVGTSDWAYPWDPNKFNDVELNFKELKSGYALDVVNTTNPQILEVYLDSDTHAYGK
jgi:hypothetical protein